MLGFGWAAARRFVRGSQKCDADLRGEADHYASDAPYSYAPQATTPSLTPAMSLPLLNRGACHLSRSSPLASTSRLTLTSPSSSSPAPNHQQQSRNSHIGSAPIYLSPNTTLTVQPYPPHPNPARPLSPALQTARSVLVKGPLGECLVPLHKGVDVSRAASVAQGTAGSTSAAAAGAVEGESARYDVVIQSSASVRAKKLVSFWGMTRALLQNAVEGVSEGHSLALRLVGVGYRAAVEADPTPRLSKLQAALQVPGARTFFTSKEQEAAYRLLAQREDAMQGGAGGTDKQQRLVLRLGYSHPISMPVPKGLTVATPQPTRIVVKGVDKEAVGLFASQIRAWRPPEPYKVSLLAQADFDVLVRRYGRADGESDCLPFPFLSHRARVCSSGVRRSSSRVQGRSKGRRIWCCAPGQCEGTVPPTIHSQERLLHPLSFVTLQSTPLAI